MVENYVVAALIVVAVIVGRIVNCGQILLTFRTNIVY